MIYDSHSFSFSSTHVLLTLCAMQDVVEPLGSAKKSSQVTLTPKMQALINRVISDIAVFPVVPGLTCLLAAALVCRGHIVLQNCFSRLSPLGFSFLDLSKSV